MWEEWGHAESDIEIKDDKEKDKVSIFNVDRTIFTLEDKDNICYYIIKWQINNAHGFQRNNTVLYTKEILLDLQFTQSIGFYSPIG